MAVLTSRKGRVELNYTCHIVINEWRSVMAESILWGNDLNGGIASAKDQNKFVLIDFNGPT